MKVPSIIVLLLSIQICYTVIPACNLIKFAKTFISNSVYYGQCGQCIASQYDFSLPNIGSFYVNCSSNYTYVYRNASCVDLFSSLPFLQVQIGPCDDCVYVEKVKYSEPYATVNNFTLLQNYSSSNCSKADNANQYYMKKNETFFSFHISTICGDNNAFNNQYFGSVVCIPTPLPTTTTIPSTSTTTFTIITSSQTTSTSTVLLDSTVENPTFSKTKKIDNTNSSEDNSALIGIVVGSVCVFLFISIVIVLFLLKRAAKIKAKEQTVENEIVQTIAEDPAPNSTYAMAPISTMEREYVNVPRVTEYANYPEESKKYSQYENVQL